MVETFFINSAMQFSIETYLHVKDYPATEKYHSFFNTVLRGLVFIYGELDITNPYRMKDEKGFITNLKKFGYEEEELDDFFKNMLLFYENVGNVSISRLAFISIQKNLIDMFFLKKSHVVISDDEVAFFESLLYTNKEQNPIKLKDYNKYSLNDNTVSRYFASKLFSSKHHFIFTEYQDITLSPEAYQLAGFNVVEVMKMKTEEIENINNKVFHFFRIKDSDLNKRGRLQNAVNYYKKYGNSITSGSGFVDLLLITSVIATATMIIVVFGM